MKFGAMIAPRISDWKLVCELEALGYDSAWIADSQMIWSDCYSVMALAALHTSRIKLGSGVTNSGTRAAPVTANAIATINQVAPGRVFLGIGTGFSSMCLMGLQPVKASAFREHVRVVRGLLAGERVEFTLGAETHKIEFLDHQAGFLNLEPRVPIYVAANGPLAYKIAGAYGDGCVSGGYSITEADDRVFADRHAQIRAGAAAAERTLPGNFHTVSVNFACILKAGESPDSERVIDHIGHIVVANTLHAWWETSRRTGSDEFIPNSTRGVWEDYLRYVEQMDIAPDQRYLHVHRGHATYLLPQERRFVTRDLIRAAGGLIGEPDELIERIRSGEKAGLREITLMPAIAHVRVDFTEFAQLVMERY